MIAHHVRPLVREGVGDVPGAVAGRRQIRVATIAQAGTDEIQANRVDAIVEVAAREATLIEDVSGFDGTLRNVKRRLVVAMLLNPIRAITRETIWAQVDAAPRPASAEHVSVRVLAHRAQHLA